MFIAHSAEMSSLAIACEFGPTSKCSRCLLVAIRTGHCAIFFDLAYVSIAVGLQLHSCDLVSCCQTVRTPFGHISGALWSYKVILGAYELSKGSVWTWYRRLGTCYSPRKTQRAPLAKQPKTIGLNFRYIFQSLFMQRINTNLRSHAVLSTVPCLPNPNLSALLAHNTQKHRTSRPYSRKCLSLPTPRRRRRGCRW